MCFSTPHDPKCFTSHHHLAATGSPIALFVSVCARLACVTGACVHPGMCFSTPRDPKCFISHHHLVATGSLNALFVSVCACLACVTRACARTGDVFCHAACIPATRVMHFTRLVATGSLIALFVSGCACLACVTRACARTRDVFCNTACLPVRTGDVFCNAACIPATSIRMPGLTDRVICGRLCVLGMRGTCVCARVPARRMFFNTECIPGCTHARKHRYARTQA